MNVILGNLNTEKRPQYGPTIIYIGRRSTPMHYGNRWTHGDHGLYPTFKVDSREDAVEAYRQWLAGEAYYTIDPDRRIWILGQVKEIAERGEDVKLMCFCVPQLCHGNVLKAMIEQAFEQLALDKIVQS